MKNPDIVVMILAGLAGIFALRQLGARSMKNTNGTPRPSKMSDAGIAQLKREEGLRLKAYKDEAGVWTIGYGHTGASVFAGQEITEAQADALLRNDLARFEKAVTDSVSVMVPLAQHEMDALVSFAFNVGEAGFRNSTLLKKFNAGDKVGAASEFDRWVYITQGGNKVVSFILQGRRARERNLFLNGIYWQ